MYYIYFSIADVWLKIQRSHPITALEQHQRVCVFTYGNIGKHEARSTAFFEIELQQNSRGRFVLSTGLPGASNSGIEIHKSLGELS